MHPVQRLRRLAARAEPSPTLDQTALQRARADTGTFVGRRPIKFLALTACAIAAATATGAVLAAKLPLIQQILVAVGGALVGVFVPVTVILASSWLLAFPRQRTEARAELRRATQPADLAGLAQGFSTWAAAKSAARPRFGGLPMQAMFSSDHPLNAIHHERNDDLARYDAEARGEYHQRFRNRVMKIVGTDWREPQTTADLVALAERVQTLAGDAQNAEAIAAAQGLPITSDHLAHLQVLRDRVQLDVLNEKPPEYGDDQRKESFFAHYRSLRPMLERWEKAIKGRDERLADLAAMIPQAVTMSRLVGPVYIDGAVADCFTEDILARFRRREYSARELQLRCVGDVPGDNPEGLWNGHLHSGIRDYSVRLVKGPAEFTKDGVAEHHRAVVAPIEAELQTCYARINSSSQALNVKKAQKLLADQRQPLIDELMRQKIAGGTPTFSSSCPYCLAAIGL